MELEVSFVSLLVCPNLVVVCMCVATSENSFILTYHDSFGRNYFAIRFFPSTLLLGRQCCAQLLAHAVSCVLLLHMRVLETEIVLCNCFMFE